MKPKYPWLVIRNRFTGKVVEELKDCSEIDDLPRGWYIAFGEQMIDELNELLVKANYADKYRIMQIKEKFGTLRWYDGSIPKSIYPEYTALIKKYEKLSATTCVICGAQGEIDYKAYWLEPLCKKCLSGMKNDVPANE